MRDSHWTLVAAVVSTVYNALRNCGGAILNYWEKTQRQSSQERKVIIYVKRICAKIMNVLVVAYDMLRRMNFLTRSMYNPTD